MTKIFNIENVSDAAEMSVELYDDLVEKINRVRKGSLLIGVSVIALCISTWIFEDGLAKEIEELKSSKGE